MAKFPKAENSDDGKSASMKICSCCTALGFWRFRYFAVRKIEVMRLHEELSIGTDVAVGLCRPFPLTCLCNFMQDLV